MNFDDLRVKVYEFLHLRPKQEFSNLNLSEYGILTYSDKDLEKFDDDNPVYDIGKSARNQMIGLDKTLISFKKSIIDSLPDYLKDNLDSVDIDTSHLTNVCLKFHFKNYNKMNKMLVNDIRSDFRECTGLNQLPSYKVKFNDDNFVLFVFVINYL